MTKLETYLQAVEKRKAIDGHRVNYAMAAQLEKHDIPLLLEIIRFMALERDQKCSVECECDDAHLEAIAARGSTARFGDYVPPGPDGQASVCKAEEAGSIPAGGFVLEKVPSAYTHPVPGLEGW